MLAIAKPGYSRYDLPVMGVAAMVLISARLFTSMDCTHGIAEAPTAPTVPLSA
ncbi:MAG: hypothetical protein ACREDL_10865 [Bradyrhizobium sp.]